MTAVIKMKKEYKKRLLVKPIIYGLFGGFSLLLVYFIILSLVSSFYNSIQQFIPVWYWIITLAFGFGIQIGLLTYIRGFVKIKSIENSAKGTVIATGGISTASMITCCLHRVTDILPFIGVVGISIFITKYQAFFLLLGVLSNLAGISLMLKMIQSHKLYLDSGFFKRLMNVNMKNVFYFIIISSIILLLAKLIIIGGE